MDHNGEKQMRDKKTQQDGPIESLVNEAELKKRLVEMQTAVRRLEEAQVVSQQIMKLEVSI